MKARWTMLLAVATLAGVLSLAGCSGDDGSAGSAGAAGAAGAAGPAGPAGPAGDPGVDATADPIAAAKPEACATCHGGVGDEHQAGYDAYPDASKFALDITAVTSTAAIAPATGFDLSVEFSITHMGSAYLEDVSSFDSIGFYVAQRDAAGEWLTSGPPGTFYPALAAGDAVNNGDGTYTLAQNVSYDALAFVGGAIIGKIAKDELEIGDVNTAARVHLYDDLAHDVWPIGDIGTFVSPANVEACQGCHGTPFYKHGNIAAKIDGAPDFVQCHACHVDDVNGGHEDWQYMVDDPFGQATGVTPTADYTYTRSFMNDVHMSHAMEFPYPQSMSNCTTCHAGKMDVVLADENFTAETCKSCHPVTGVDTAPRTFDAVTGDEILGGRSGTSPVPAIYNDGRAPSLAYIWEMHGVPFHNAGQDCQSCHTDANPVAVTRFSDLHNGGFDARITDATDGVKWADKLTASIDSVDVTGSVVTVEFSVSDADMVPYIYLSFYGYDTKQFIVPSHARDANRNRYEAKPDDTNDLFAFTPATLGATSYIAVMDMSLFVGADTANITDLITDGVIKTAQVTLPPRYTTADGVAVGLDSVFVNFDATTGAVVDDYFTGANAVVLVEKCEACHDKLAVTFHGGSGRSNVETCKNCHAPVFTGSHLEMASRSIENYVHAIHSFQAFDPGDINFDDPVEAQRYEHHVEHTFPNFTITNCEACHAPGTYNVPDQAKSLPGVLSASDDVMYRNLTVPEYVTGPASRACGACHRAHEINENELGALASFNTHTEMGGTLVENDADDVVLYGVIDKIMSMFQ